MLMVLTSHIMSACYIMSTITEILKVHVFTSDNVYILSHVNKDTVECLILERI